ncbi:hypothetical protein L288_10630 [Sphingobium quisquiliarum P25]|uniref:Uncharacterized protein n=1 Tax=Sphingobium quisquiliarum P25 TaxID=1329909 RepID=T0GS33_9SPHN|nr:hypothetical protein L288_10630 [Sphingobium quisquiliarum P25]
MFFSELWQRLSMRLGAEGRSFIRGDFAALMEKGIAAQPREVEDMVGQMAIR